MITLMLLIPAVGGILSTTVVVFVHNIWVKRGWNDAFRPVVMGIGMIITMLAIMVPGHILMIKVGEALSFEPVTRLELPEVQSFEFRPWVDTFDDHDVHCLALNIYFEARGEDVRGKYAVADVVMYRYMHADYPETVCGVVEDGHYHEWRPDLPVKHMCQFSWFCDGKSDKPLNLDAFEEAIDIAKEVLYDSTYVPRVEYSLFYHATSVSPGWSKSMKFVETIGNHSFYTMKRGHVVP